MIASICLFLRNNHIPLFYSVITPKNKALKLIVQFLKQHIDTCIAAALAFYFVLLLTQHGGIGISPDSIMYTSVARNLTLGNGFLQFDGKPLTMFPVAFPYFLHLIMLLTQQDIVVVAPYLTAILFAGNVCIAGYILENASMKNRIYKNVVLLLLITNPALLEVYTMLWSETLFIFLVMLFIVVQQRYIHHADFKNLLFAAVIAGIAAITRYAGITVIATGCFLLLFATHSNWTKRWMHTILFGCISSSFLCINLLSNVLQSGYLTGKRLPADTSFIENMQLYGNVLAGWLGSNHPSMLYALLLGILLIIITGIYLYTAIVHQKKEIGFTVIAEAFLLIYVLFIILSSTFSNYDDINNRLLAPVAIPFFLIICAGIHQMINASQKSSRTTMILAGLLALFAFIGNLNNGYTTLKNNHEAGIGGYAEDYWQSSDILHFLKTSPFTDTATIPLYSNDYAAIYYFTGKKVKTLPELTHENELNVFLQTNALYVIWLNSGDNPDLIEHNEINKVKQCILMHTFSDGIIYKCIPLNKPFVQKDSIP